MTKGFGVIYLLIGVLVLSSLAGAVYFGKLPVKFLPFQTPTPRLQESTTDEKAGWQTFVNKEQGFSIKYPNTWINTGEEIINSASPMGDKGEKLFKKGVIYIKFYSSKGEISDLDFWLDKVISEYGEMEGDPPYRSYQSKEKVVIADTNQALKVMAEGYGQLNYTDYFILNPLKKEGIQLSIVYPFNEINEQKELIDQILSTFKFN